MANPLPLRLLDAQLSFERGVDTYQAPARVPRNQSCLLINQTTRQDYIGPRPGYTQRLLRFVDATGSSTTPAALALREAFETGLFQGFTGYIPDNGPAQLIFSVSGQTYRIDPGAVSVVQQLALPGGVTQPPNRPRVWFQQAELFLVIQDGQSKPLIYNGSSLRQSDTLGTSGKDADGTPLYEVPVGTVMAYASGRLWVAGPGRAQAFNEVSFVAGDGVYGPTGTAAYTRRDAVLRFTENTYLNGGAAFAVPSNMGRITAMRAVANLDTSLGQGPLQVFTPQGCFSVDAPFDRTLWAAMTNPIKTVSLLDQGALSSTATVLVNGDIWYRSLDGVRSFLIARRDFGTWGNRAMSYEVIRHLKDDDQTLLSYASGALFDNRLLVTCAPRRDAAHGIYHSGLVALDFIPLTSMQGSEPPCWDGLWTGLDILALQTVESGGINYCYAAVLSPPDSGGVRRIQLWELTRNQGFDQSSTGLRTRLTRVVEGPRLDFSLSGSTRFEQKLLEAADLWIDKVSGVVDFTLYYRPDEHPCWFFWKHWQVCTRVERCSTDAIAGCLTGLNLRPQYRPRIGALRPPENTVTFTGQPARLGYLFQYRLEIVGECELTSIRLLATRILEQTFGSGLPDTALCEEVICCEPDQFRGGPSYSPSDPGSTTGNPPTPPPEPPGPPGPPVPPITPPADNGPITDYPNLPPHNRVPDTNLPPPSGGPNSFCAYAYPSYTTNTPGDPNGDVQEMGVYQLSDVQPTVMTQWAAAAWAWFSQFAADNSITVTAAQVQWQFAPSTGRRWNANQVFLTQNYLATFGYDWTMVIYYCVPL